MMGAEEKRSAFRTKDECSAFRLGKTGLRNRLPFDLKFLNTYT